jgi:glycosyltransferase involved in cell wall biosynthesis
LKSNSFDTVYLNSFFEFKFSIYPATLKFLRLVRLGNTVVAPRGEFYDEALNFKSKKKELFLKVIRSIGVYKRVTWHSTETGESKEIEKLFGGHARIAEARVLSDFSNVIKHSYDVEFETEIPTLKIVFLSRISKDKNVPYIFDVLEKVSRPLEIHFYGPIEDEDIWEECLDKMKHLPENIVAKYKGPVVKKDVKGVFSKYDMFFLPTHRENFGHVISESLSVGTPVLISTNTPWQNLASHGLGWDNDLNHMQDFVNVLTSYEINGEKDREIKRMNVIDKFNSYMNIEETINENVNLFSK